MDERTQDTLEKKKAISPEVAVLVAQAIILYLTRLGQVPVFADDAYIHFRNAWN